MNILSLQNLTRFYFCKLDLNDHDHFCFKSLIETVKRKAQASVRVTILFWQNATSVIRIGSKIPEKTLSSWQKTSKSNSKPSQSTNQSMHTLTNCWSCGYSLELGNGMGMWGSLVLKDK